MRLPGGSDPRIADLSMISFADISLQKTAKTARSGRGRPVCERAVRHAAKFGETGRGNLACCPDHKVRRYFLGDFVVAPAPDALPSPIIRRGDATRAPLRRSFRVTVIISAVPSGGELTG